MRQRRIPVWADAGELFQATSFSVAPSLPEHSPWPANSEYGHMNNQEKESSRSPMVAPSINQGLLLKRLTDIGLDRRV